MSGHGNFNLRTAFFLLILSFLSSCITLQAPQVKSVDHFQTSGLLSGTPQVRFDVNLFNPNNFGLNLTDFKINVSHNGRSLATIRTSESRYLNPSADITIPLSFSPTKEQIDLLIQSGLSVLQGAPVKLTGDGSLTVQKFIFSKTFNIKF